MKNLVTINYAAIYNVIMVTEPPKHEADAKDHVISSKTQLLTINK